MLEPLTSPTAADWLLPGLSWPADGRHVVTHCLPSGYDAYVKLLHPIYVGDTSADGAATWADADPAEVLADFPSDIVEALEGVKFVNAGAGVDPRGRRIRWADLARHVGASLHADITFWRLLDSLPGDSMQRAMRGPNCGTLDRPTCEALVGMIERHAPAERCLFAYDEIATVDVAEHLLFTGDLHDITLTFARDDVHGTPTTWWPESRAWSVHTDWDLRFTLVGGPRSLIDALMASGALELVEVCEESRVDSLRRDDDSSGAG